MVFKADFMEVKVLFCFFVVFVFWRGMLLLWFLILNYKLRLPDTIYWKRRKRKSIGKLLEIIEFCEVAG